ncbi:unnamed protein product [Ambrosiozyma monospora]|uniref:Unnamed protein product n=1 Tax=Ambrosiozyma monospora TaxID=43982 RepID=A0ACB5T416_AMBMO|nr:unnamed protein product [Ambrosiozyma monospora]
MSLNGDNMELKRQIDTIDEELQNLKQASPSFEIGERHGDDSDFSELSSYFTGELKKVNEALSHLESSLDDFKVWKEGIDRKFTGLDIQIHNAIMSQLPDNIPVVEQQGEIQLAPTVVKFIEDIVTSKVKNSGVNPDWNMLYQENSKKDELSFISRDDLKKSVDQIHHSIKESIGYLKRELEERYPAEDGAVMDPKLITQAVKSAVNIELTNNSLQGRTSMVNYATPQQGGRVVNKLTTLPKLKRLRTEFWDRVRNGISDWFKRTFMGNKRYLIGLQGIELTTDINSPTHALIEDNSYWQCLVEDIPVLFTIQLSQPIYVQQVGIYHSRQANYMLDVAPKSLELAVKPKYKKDYKNFFNIVSRFYNQEFNVKAMKGFVKVSEFDYSIKSAEHYQQFPMTKQIHDILNVVEVDRVMIIINSNHGNGRITALQNVKVFGLNEFEMKNAKLFLDDSNVGDLGDDTTF